MILPMSGGPGGWPPGPLLRCLGSDGHGQSWRGGGAGSFPGLVAGAAGGRNSEKNHLKINRTNKTQVLS